MDAPAKGPVFQFRHHRYDVELRRDGYRVFLDGNLCPKKGYGQITTIPAQPPRKLAPGLSAVLSLDSR